MHANNAPSSTSLASSASGSIGHLAVPLGARMGARVFATASGEDGLALARGLGVEAGVDGHSGVSRSLQQAHVALSKEALSDSIEPAKV